MSSSHAENMSLSSPADNMSVSSQERGSLLDTSSEKLTLNPQTTPTRQKDISCIQRQGIACSEDEGLDAFAELQCGHAYCPSCLHQMVSVALQDHLYLPPKCCGRPILISTIQDFVHTTVVNEYRARFIEQEAIDRTYCHERACSILIPPENIVEVAQCPHCPAQTCVICKGPSHEGYCPEEAGLEETLAAVDGDYQCCLACWRIVIKREGCDHMK